MNFIIILVMIVMFVYTAGFSIQLWKEKNRIGSITVFIMALTLAILPFFTILR
jgi:hypothetical protein